MGRGSACAWVLLFIGLASGLVLVVVLWVHILTNNIAERGKSLLKFGSDSRLPISPYKTRIVLPRCPPLRIFQSLQCVFNSVLGYLAQPRHVDAVGANHNILHLILSLLRLFLQLDEVRPSETEFIWLRLAECFAPLGSPIHLHEFPLFIILIRRVLAIPVELERPIG